MVPTQSSTNFLFHFPKFHLSPFLISLSLSLLSISLITLSLISGSVKAHLLPLSIYLSVCISIYLSMYPVSAPDPRGILGLGIL